MTLIETPKMAKSMQMYRISTKKSSCEETQMTENRNKIFQKSMRLQDEDFEVPEMISKSEITEATNTLLKGSMVSQTEIEASGLN
jgi:hypothetical protein